MSRLAPIVAAFMAGIAIALAGAAFAYDPVPTGSLYDRIYARYGHLGRDVHEKFDDGPCRIERHWERDGDFEEEITCRGSRR